MENTTQTTAPEFIFSDQFTIQDRANTEFYAQLLRGMTHKLNNLLAVIQGFSSLILMNDEVEEEIAENIGHMKEAAQNASGLSERILPAGGCVNISLQDLKLSEYFAMTESSFTEPCKKLGVPFKMKYPESTPIVKADPGRLKEVIMELLTNGAEAAQGNGGEVSLDVSNPGDGPIPGSDRLDLFVRNSGSTIPKEKMGEIFAPFYSSKDSSHFGVGLTTASVLASQMGMRLGVHSDDNVTTFWLSIPVA